MILLKTNFANETIFPHEHTHDTLGIFVKIVLDLISAFFIHLYMFEER